jgi:hypothetical protein
MLEEIANLVAEYREKVKDFSKFRDDCVYIDYERLNDDMIEIIKNLEKIVNNNLAPLFVKSYDSVDEAVFEMEMVFEEFIIEVDRLKCLYKELEKYKRYDEKLNVYQKIISRLLEQIETFLLRLENLLLRGGKGSLTLEFDVTDEIMELKEKFHKDEVKKVSFGSFLLGLGLGWLIFGGDDEE